jgi:hypothetical protein
VNLCSAEGTQKATSVSSRFYRIFRLQVHKQTTSKANGVVIFKYRRKQCNSIAFSALTLMMGTHHIITKCCLGGIMVSMLATRPKVRGFKPGRGDGFLSAIKIGGGGGEAVGPMSYDVTVYIIL